MTEDEILHAKPRGTYAVLLVYIAVFTLSWLFFYLLFLSRGPIN
ncbi:hypothetical protein MNB_SUP05-SYMBIONT-4-1287 [hydrothermal vent metagenome]